MLLVLCLLFWVVFFIVLILGFGLVSGYYGWGWVIDQEFEIIGIVVFKCFGNFYGEVIFDVDGKYWVIEVGQFWCNC